MKAKLAILGMLTTVAALLVACQAEPKVEDNPTFDPEENTVDTKLYLNISTESGKETKTTAKYAQIGSTNGFLGMEAVHILAYNLTYPSGPSNFFYNAVDESAVAIRDYDFGELFTASTSNPSFNTRTVQLALPLGTNCLTLYGKAKKTGTDDEQGVVKIVSSKENPSDVTHLYFDLVPRLSSMDAYEGGGFLFSRILNYFLAAGLVNEEEGFWATPTGTEDRSYGFWWPLTGDDRPTAPGTAHKQVSGNYTYYCGQVSWKQMGRQYDIMYDTTDSTDPATITTPTLAVTALSEMLGEAYSRIVNVREKDAFKEIRAGSAKAFLGTMQDLYAVVDKVSSSEPTGWEEEVARELAALIKSRMLDFFEMVSGELLFINTDTAKPKLDKTKPVDVTTLKNRISSRTSPPDYAAYEKKVALVDTSYFPTGDNLGFPINLGIPYGAASMKVIKRAEINRVDSFDYNTTIPAYGMGETSFDIKNYRFPPELLYYANSPLRVSNKNVDEVNLATTEEQWMTDSFWSSSSWDSSNSARVTSATRTVAMKCSVNYGTALLETTLQYASGLTQLEDNQKYVLSEESNNVITIPTDGSGGLEVTGIVVGGQPHAVGWDFTRQADDDNSDWTWDAENKCFTGVTFENNKFEMFIYDKVAPRYVGNTSPIYTFVWDNYDALRSADDQSDVYVGIELVNKLGRDFYGELNLIKEGGTFYLVGKLDLSEATNINTFKKEGNYYLNRTDYKYPPFDPKTGETINAPRVFMQDYMTKAKIILDKKCLQHAYVTVPDLRSSQISLGLSIDLEWEPGPAFNVIIGEDKTTTGSNTSNNNQ